MKIKFYSVDSSKIAIKRPKILDEAIGEISRDSVLFVDSNVDDIYNISALGFRNIILPAGERAKSLNQLERNILFLKNCSADRLTPIVAIGGGAVCDSAAFAASVYKRGAPLTLVPTTLVAQADAALGGKTALNFDGAKNLVGTFYQPKSIILLPGFLSSLPEERYREGLAECVKTALVASPLLFAEIRKSAREFTKMNAALNARLVSQCANIKMRIVAKDPFDRGLRRILNFGHTFGHAVESISKISHGFAVAIGMTFSLLFAEKHGLMKTEQVNDILDLFRELKLPIKRPEIDPADIFDKIINDKKIASGKLSFITLGKAGNPVIVGISISKFKASLYDLYVAWENRI